MVSSILIVYDLFKIIDGKLTVLVNNEVFDINLLIGLSKIRAIIMDLDFRFRFERVQ